MSPTNKEMQLQKNCQLYAYVLVAQNKEVPFEVLACMDSYDDTINCVEQLVNEIKSLDKESLNNIMYNKNSIESQKLAQWWEMHQEADRLHKMLSCDV